MVPHVLKMVCAEKTKQLTLLDFHLKKLMLVKVEGDSESQSDLEVENESLDKQGFLETECDIT